MARHTKHLAAAGIMAIAVSTTATACNSEDAPTTSGTSTSQPGSPGSSEPGIAVGEPHPKMADLTKYTSQQVAWDEGTCPESMKVMTVTSNRTSCAKVTAPKDYTDPSKGDISLMVARTKSTGANPRILFTNPGGPGGPAARFSALVSSLSPLAATHDVIGIDPRGTGDSTPVSCEPARTGVNDNRKLSPNQMTTVQAAVKKSVKDCTDKHGDYLPYITSDNTARDHDLVRQLLGQDKVDYYGVSAGTWLGARYATLFPQHVGRFVLDSNTDFTDAFSKTFERQPMAFQRRWDQQFLPWAARNNDTYQLGSDGKTVNAAYEKVRQAARDNKLDDFTPNIIDNVMAQQMYSDRGFKSAAGLLALLNKAADGDQDSLDRAVSSLNRGGAPEYTDNRESTTFMAVTCNDTAWNKNQLTYAASSYDQGGRYPLIGYDIATNPCAYWPYTAPQTKVDLKGAPPMLLVQTELDPATAYEGAIAAHKAVPDNTRFLAVDNQGNHGAVVGGSNGCVSTVSYDFLTKGKLIEKDGVCPAVPLPGDKAVYAVGQPGEGEKLPMTDGYERQKPNLQQQLLQILLDLLAQATGPRNNK